MARLDVVVEDTLMARMQNHLDPEAFHGGCRAKVRHTSKRHAIGALRVQGARGVLNRPDTLMVYKCRQCHGWHLGNPNRRQQRLLQEAAASLSEDSSWTAPEEDFLA